MGSQIKSALWETIKFAVVTLAIVLPVRAYVAQPFIVSGNSMYPTFKNNEYLIIDELSYHLREPKRGEVIVFRFPQEPDTFFIKRIIGLPGELVELADGSNVQLGADEYFVMGDNRDSSLDSRSWGALPRELVTGRVFLRLFPPGRVGYLPGSEQNNYE